MENCCKNSRTTSNHILKNFESEFLLVGFVQSSMALIHCGIVIPSGMKDLYNTGSGNDFLAVVC